MNKQSNSVLVRVIAVVGALLIMVGATDIMNTRLTPNYQGSMLTQASGLQAQQVVMTINGVDITAEEYLYQIASSGTQLAYMGITDLSADLGEGYTAANYVEDAALNEFVKQVILSQWLEEAGVAPSEEQMAAIDTQLESVREEVGGEAAFAQRLYVLGMSRALLEASMVNSMKEDLLVNAYCGAGGALRPSDEEMSSFAQENSLAMVKVIAFDGCDITDEKELADLQQQATDAAKRIEDAADPAAEFDAVAAELEQDASAQLMDCSQEGTLYEAANKAPVGEFAGLVKDGDDCYLLMVVDLDLDQIAYTMLNKEYSQRAAAVDVVYTDVFRTINTADFVAKFSTLQADATANASK